MSGDCLPIPKVDAASKVDRPIPSTHAGTFCTVWGDGRTSPTDPPTALQAPGTDWPASSVREDAPTAWPDPSDPETPLARSLALVEIFRQQRRFLFHCTHPAPTPDSRTCASPERQIGQGNQGFSGFRASGIGGSPGFERAASGNLRCATAPCLGTFLQSKDADKAKSTESCLSLQL